MAKQKKSGKSPAKATSETRTSQGEDKIYCSLPEMPEPVFGPELDPHRASLLAVMSKMWANGTVLHYYFFDKDGDGEEVTHRDGSTKWYPWTTTKKEKDIIRKGFRTWKDVGIGLEFVEVDTRDEAEIRIGFMRGDGSWSYIGRDVLGQGLNKRTMNFGWDLTGDPEGLDTAVHEIGHTLGFPHEHQNPKAGIVWDEEKVYATLAQPPNNWSREKTYYNIIRKINPDTVQGSNWDPNSIMHYPFGPGLILEPKEYNKGLNPEPGLSPRDKSWVKSLYPSLDERQFPLLKPFVSKAAAGAVGAQSNYLIKPEATRQYEFRTFGRADTVMVLFEDVDGRFRYLTADDDSGGDGNAYLRYKLFKGRKYVLRVRCNYIEGTGELGAMMW
jgi:hypothetical protein